MAHYSIKDLETLSGIKAHTLRIWEQRYNILKPSRSDTNIRFYSDEDLKILLNISFLNNNGYKISQIAKMTPVEISSLVLEMTETKSEFGQQLESLVMSMVEFDESGFEKIISTSTLRYGLEKTMLKIVYPFLNKVGVLWQTGKIKPAHEHFITHLIKQKIIVAIDGQVINKDARTKRYLLFLPEGEFHDMPLLFAYYLIKSHENRVVYLGSSVPLPDIEEVHRLYEADVILTVFTSMISNTDLNKYIHTLSAKFSDAEILVAGQQVMNKELEFPSNVNTIRTIKQLLEFIQERSSAETMDKYSDII